MLYIYLSHIGALFTSEEELDFDDRYCELCGDYDWFIGCANTKEEARNLLINNDVILLDTKYIEEFINKHWEA